MRDKILDATERLLARYGYAKMTVEDIAREAGIGKGTPTPSPRCSSMD